MSTGISIAVLCGGPSRRFGSEKAMAVAGERTLVQWIVDRLAAETDDIFLQLCSTATVPASIPVNIDPVPGCGPKSGIHGALLHARHPRVFVCASDMPAVDPRLVRVLARRGEADAVVPRWDNGWIEPLSSLYARSVLPVVADQLDRGRFRLADMLETLDQVVYVPIEPLVEAGELAADCFLNINSRDELERWAARRGLASVIPTGRA
jgi:molybdopterin-guanine dinucleotide biosynthesis protein A